MEVALHPTTERVAVRRAVRASGHIFGRQPMKTIDADREYQGLRIAATVKLRQVGASWYVPSQTTDQEYRADPVAGWCSCTDHGVRKAKCKHLWAVEFTSMREGIKARDTDYDYHAETQRVLQEIDKGQAEAGTPF